MVVVTRRCAVVLSSVPCEASKTKENESEDRTADVGVEVREKRSTRKGETEKEKERKSAGEREGVRGGGVKRVRSSCTRDPLTTIVTSFPSSASLFSSLGSESSLT